MQPIARNIEDPSFFAANSSEALRRFDEARKNGATLIDSGCMQIDRRFHPSQFRSLAAIFDPHENVDYAARFLKELGPGKAAGRGRPPIMRGPYINRP